MIATHMLSDESTESVGGVSLGGLASLGVDVGNIDLLWGLRERVKSVYYFYLSINFDI